MQYRAALRCGTSECCGRERERGCGVQEQAQFAASLEPVATAPDANATVSDNTTAPTPLSAAPTEAPPLTVVDDIPSGSSPTTPNEADEGVAKTSNNNSHIYWLVGSAVVGSLVATVALIVLIGYRRRQRRASGSELKPGADHVHGKGLEAVRNHLLPRLCVCAQGAE